MVRGHDLFLSHSSGDQDVARELRGVLESFGYACWMAPDDVTSTTSWAEQILTAIEASRAVIVLVSSNAGQSEHVSREVNLALGRDRPVIPIRIEPDATGGALEYFLSLVQRIDAYPPPITNHSETIRRRLASMVPVTKLMRSGRRVRERTSTSHDRSTVADGPAERGAIGSTLAGFTIDAVLGEGGMATVYRARQAEPARSVALKVIRSDHAADPTYRQRFLAETETLARLEHPGIVPIYAAGESAGTLYIAMRLVDGPDLGARIRATGHLELPETIDLLRPIAEAVDYAHQMGVVHRDLKPSNIIVDQGGRAYLTDFGLGKRIVDGQGLSTPGVALGTLEYMAPEQFGGSSDTEPVAASDIYALGGVIFTCLTGRAPYDAERPDHVLYAKVNDPVPPVSAARPDLPSAVERVVARAMAGDPASRFASARELVTALEAAQFVRESETRPIVITQPAWPSFVDRIRTTVPRSAAMAAVAVVAVVGIGAAASGLGPFASPAPTGGPDASQQAEASLEPSGPTASPAGEPSADPTSTSEPTVAPTGPPTASPTPSATPGPTPTRRPGPTQPTAPTPTPAPAPTPTPAPPANQAPDALDPGYVSFDVSVYCAETRDCYIFVLDRIVDPDGDALTLTKVGPTFHDNNTVYVDTYEGMQVAHWIADAGFTGANDSFYFYVSDGHGHETQVICYVTDIPPS